MDPVIEARLVVLRRSHPRWGSRTLTTKLRGEFDKAPSRAALYRALVRHQLIILVPAKRSKHSYQRWERSKAMELWQMDVVSWIQLTNGTQLHCVTGIDDHSRFCVSAKLVTRAIAKPVCDALLLALRRHSVPEEILTGRLLSAKLDSGLSVSAVRRIRSVLGQVIDQGIRWGSVRRNVARLSRAPKEQRREGRTLTYEQARRLLKELEEHRHEALYSLMLSTGLRRGLGLQWRDFDQPARVISVRRQLKRERWITCYG
jgi:transposase InsO family protein